MKKFYTIFLIFAFTTLFADKRTGESPISCAKPDGFVHMNYSSDSVEKNEISNILISLETHLKSGKLEIDITKDSELEMIEISDKKNFQISTDKKSYNINIKVRSNQNGIFYIKLLAKISNDNFLDSKYTSFVIPVDIGDTNAQVKKIRSRRLDTNENLIIFKAVESVSGII